MHNIEAADSREVPKNCPILWALEAYYMGNKCPLLVLSMPAENAKHTQEELVKALIAKEAMDLQEAEVA